MGGIVNDGGADRIETQRRCVLGELEEVFFGFSFDSVDIWTPPGGPFIDSIICEFERIQSARPHFDTRSEAQPGMGQSNAERGIFGSS